MRIGKQDAPYTAICTSDAESITVRGHDLVGELMGQIDFTSYFWLLVTGTKPNADQLYFLNAVLGSAEIAGRFYAECVADWRESGDEVEAVARRNIERWRAHTKAVPGFGHPQHSGGDPRAKRLLAMADERGVAGEHVAMMRALKAALPETIGRDLPINVNAAIPSIMLDLGFPLAALKGIGLLCRTASLVAHCTEEAERPIGFIMSGAAAAAIEYDGD